MFPTESSDKCFENMLNHVKIMYAYKVKNDVKYEAGRC